MGPEHRIRLTNDELSFLIGCLQELADSQKQLIHIYAQMKKAHAEDIVRTEFDKANEAHSETSRKLVACTDMVRRLRATRSGGHPRSQVLAQIAMRMMNAQS